MAAGIIVGATSILVLLGGLQAPPSRVDDDGIRKVIADYQEALNAGDAARITDLFTVDAVLMLPDTPQRQGHIAIRNLFENDVLVAATFNEIVTPVEVLLFDGWGFARANITGTFTLKRTGRVVEVKDRHAVFLFTRTSGGTWTIARFVVHIGGPAQNQDAIRHERGLTSVTPNRCSRQAASRFRLLPKHRGPARG